MSKPLPAWRVWAEYIPAWSILWLLGVLPFPVAVWIATRLADLAFFLLRRPRVRAIENLVRVFGVHPDHAADLTRRVFRHAALILVETARAMRMGEAELRACLENPEVLDELRQQVTAGSPVIVVAAHLGNWEVSGLMTALCCDRLVTVGRPMNNPKLDALILRSRNRFGQEVVSKFGFFRSAIRMLRDNSGVLGVLIDQDAGQQGVMVPFFGVPASTIPVVADLALRCKAVVHQLTLYRTSGPMRFRFVYSPAVDPVAQQLDRDGMMAKLNQMMEAAIRQAPEQWLWMHRRWKTTCIGAQTTAEADQQSTAESAATADTPDAGDSFAVE